MENPSKGHPKWYGQRFSLSDPETWTEPDDALTQWETSRPGKVYRLEIQAWHHLFMTGKNNPERLPMHKHPFTLVRPEAVQRQLEADAKRAATVTAATSTTSEPGARSFDTTVPGVERGESTTPQEKIYRLFYGAVELDPLKAPLQVKTISDEIIQHLQSLVGAGVTITLEIEAHIPDGAPENVVRTVSENARTLKFKLAEFEE